jgi:hypothetical protein
MARCPICRKPVPEEEAEYPFCSRRCRTIDLGNWASEKYVVSVPIAEEEDDSVDDGQNDD